LAGANERLHEGAALLLGLLGRALDEGEPDLPRHAEACARHAIEIGGRLGLTAPELADLRLAASLHDVARLVAEPSRALGRDWEHAVRGARLLATLPVSPGVVECLRHHHERWDGVGGPSGLAGSEIPVLARVLAVADELAGLQAGRHGPALSADAARAVVARRAGRWLDPDVVAAALGGAAAGDAAADDAAADDTAERPAVVESELTGVSS
jgi:HD-GYP domain-containing protein (c-di-GMP phosphodiesterase class II)